jgi:GDPmannose 4,6-dehydratase
MIAIIFGINGQDGFYLNQLLTEKKIKVIGVSRTPGSAYMQGDIVNTAFVEQLIKEEQPTYVFHLAANSTTQHYALFENHETISTGTLNVLEAVYKHSKHTKVFLSGSAVQFENKGVPINEETPFAPLSAYAVARIQSVYAGKYFHSLGLQVYIGYFFNHDSPMRTERHVNKKISEAVKRIMAGSNEKIEIGNILVKKEFNYAGDVVDAVWKLMNQEVIYEAVIGSGRAYSIKEWISKCFSHTGIENWQNYVIEKEGYKAEYETLVSDPQRLYSIGWTPKVSFDELAKIMVYS